MDGLPVRVSDELSGRIKFSNLMPYIAKSGKPCNNHATLLDKSNRGSTWEKCQLSFCCSALVTNFVS